MKAVKLDLKQELKTRQVAKGTEVWDMVRKKYVALTPEEFVRQHFVQFLLHDLGYPRSLIKIESGMVVNRMQKRSDIVVYTSQGRPRILVECKSFKETLSQGAAKQIANYNQEIKAPFLVLTNGHLTLIYHVDEEKMELKPISGIPAYD